MRQRGQEGGAGPLPLGKLLDPRLRIQLEVVPQLFRVVGVPAREESRGIVHQLPHWSSTPADRALPTCSQCAQHPRRISDGVFAEDAHSAALGS